MRIVLFTLALLLAAGCSKKKPREQATRDAVTALQDACNKKDLSAIKALLAPNYSDARGNTRKGVIRMLQLRFLRQGSVHSAVRIADLSFPSKNAATAELLVVVGATGNEDDALFENLRGDMFKVTLDLRYDDDWKISGASWRRASTHDLLD